MKTTTEIKKQLFEELEDLKDERGLIKAGLPYYDRFFGRDSLIVSWQLLSTNPDNCKKTLEILSELQGKEINKEREEEPGKIIHETDFKRTRHPKGLFPFPYYGSVDSTPWYIILFYFYFQKTKNKEFIRKYWKNILAAIEWMEKYGDKDRDYFLEYERQNPQGLFHQGWKDAAENIFKIKPPVAIVEVQGYQYLALRYTAILAKILRKSNLEKNFLKRAEKLKQNFNEKFWMPKEKYFALALDGKKNQRKIITSNPGHLLFTGILKKEKEKLVVKRLFQKDLWTPFGIRTHSAKEPDFASFAYHRGSIWPHDNWIIAQGLKKFGYLAEYQKIKKAVLKTYQILGFMPECYIAMNNEVIRNYRACFLQAWSSGTLLHFLTT